MCLQCHRYVGTQVLSLGKGKGEADSEDFDYLIRVSGCTGLWDFTFLAILLFHSLMSAAKAAGKTVSLLSFSLSGDDGRDDERRNRELILTLHPFSKHAVPADLEPDDDGKDERTGMMRDAQQGYSVR